MILQRIMYSKPAIIHMFHDEYYTREQPGKQTQLEQLTLKVAQEALEGENYVNLSLLPLIIWKLKNTLHTNLGALNDLE
jgi:hypothetical protein